MFTQKELKKLIKVSEKDSGSFKVFVKINDNFGLKLCQDEKVRDNNFDRQELASLVDLGPNVYGKFDIEINGTVLFGYYTEVVEVFQCIDEFKERFKDVNLDDLRLEVLRSTRFDCYDVRWANIGIKNKSLVLIDFDDESTMEYSCSTEIFIALDKL